MIPSTLLILAGLAFAGQAVETSATARKAPAALATRVWEATDAVLDHHIDPPARQEMILEGIKRFYVGAGVATPGGLARRTSALSGPEQLAALLDEAWSQNSADKITVSGTEFEPDEFLIQSMLASLPGGARLLTAQELKVEEQFAGNRYVGLQIALGFDQNAKRPSIASVLKGGPADRAGVKNGDLIEEIDGKSTEGLALAKVVERLRGAEGTQVVIRVRQPKEAETREITVSRGVLPKTTVRGVRGGSETPSGVLINDNDSIGCLKFEEILGSTPHELRVLARRLEDAGAKGLVLDMRSVGQAHFHPTVLLADSLLDGGTIGRMRTAAGAETFRAEPDALFQGWPLAVLVDNATPPSAQWLAAALQDNHRAVIVGMAGPRGVGARGLVREQRGRGYIQADVLSAVPVGDGSSSIEMATGRLERGDGRSLLAVPNDPKSGLVPDIEIAATPQRPPVVPQRENPLLPGLTLNLPPAVEPIRPNARVPGDPVMAAAVQRLRELLKSR